MAFEPGQGSLKPISDADRARILGAGIVLEECPRCVGTGVAYRYRDGAEGELHDEECRSCHGRGALTWDGCQVPETLCAGALRCARCQVSTLRDGASCDCCQVCGASPREQCSDDAHAIAEAA